MALILTLLSHSAHLHGRWWDGLTMQQRLNGQLHLRSEAKAALRTLASHQVAARRPALSARSERKHRHTLAVLRREVPETREALRALEEAEARRPAATGVPTTNGGSASSSVPSGSVWYALAQCESGGDWSYNGPSGFDGGLQFLPSTWVAAGGPGYGYAYAWQAPASVQIAVAQSWLARTSWAQWPACSAALGLR